MSSGGKSGGGDSKYFKKQEQRRQERIRSGTAAIDATFKQFDDGFYDQQRQAYLDYAMPQLETQRADAGDQLSFSLARAGQSASSTAGQQTAKLQRLYDTQAQHVTDQALQYETDARNNVAGAKDTLRANLAATGDQNAATSGALARAQALSAGSAYSPLAQLFTDFTSGLSTAYAAQRAFANANAGAASVASSPTAFAPSRGAVIVR